MSNLWAILALVAGIGLMLMGVTGSYVLLVDLGIPLPNAPQVGSSGPIQFSAQTKQGPVSGNQLPVLPNWQVLQSPAPGGITGI